MVSMVRPLGQRHPSASGQGCRELTGKAALPGLWNDADNVAHIPCAGAATVTRAVLVSRNMLMILHTIACIAASRKQDDYAHIYC